MAIVIPDGFVQATINYTGPTRSGRGATVLGFAQPPDMEFPAMATALGGAFTTNLAGEMHNSWAVINFTIVTEDEGYVSDFGTISGTRSGEMSPPNVTMLMKKNTVRRGRAFRGRSYWPGMTNDTDVGDDGSLTSGRRGALQGALNGFFSDLEEDGIAQVLLHNDGSVEPTYVNSITVEPKVATQRRRLR